MNKSFQLIIKRGVYGIGSLLVILEAFFLHRSSHFAQSGVASMDGWTGFYAGLGLIGAGILVALAWLLRGIVSVGDVYDTYDV